MLKAIRIWVINQLMHYVCNGLTVDDLMKVTVKRTVEGKNVHTVQIGHEVLKPEEVKLLGEQARLLKKLNVWTKLVAHMRSQATDDMVNKSRIVDDMVFAKAMLYTLQVQDEVLERIASV